MTNGLKHLVTCRCVLSQFKHRDDPPQHQFVVFSVVDDHDVVRPKFVQCNNCGVVHKVTEINRSEIMQGREDMRSIVKIDDIRSSLPQGLVSLLDQNDADIPTWEAVQHTYDTEQWGNFVVLSTDEEDGLRQGKYVRVMSKTMFKVETFTREEVFK
jgi:hypothetical protein